MSTSNPPTFEEFLSLSNTEISAVAPKTIIYSVSGTRRSAELAGVSSGGDEYARWSREQMIRCLKLLVDHGIKHILMPVLTPSQFNEATPNYREHLWRWLDWGLAGDQALADYERLGWQVRIPFIEELPHLSHIQTRLEGVNVATDAPRIWAFVIPEHNSLTRWMLKKVQLNGNLSTNQEAVECLYGENIPPATLYIDFGKPIISPDLLPPFLVGKLDSYWTQQPGYRLTEKFLRSILYDSLYLRNTWQANKSERAKKAVESRDLWEGETIIGLGQRVGAYWFPADQLPL